MQNPFNKPSKCSSSCKTGGPKARIEAAYETWIVNLATKILLTWMSMLTEDESH
jgi:hypothetical protein